MNIVKELFIGIMFVATSAQSTTSYPIPLVPVDTNNPIVEIAQLSNSYSNESLLANAAGEKVSKEEVKEIDLLSINTLDATLPLATRREYVQAFYEHQPVLARIAFCESTLKHNEEDGSVLRGKVDSRDVGVMQINEHYHGKTAKDLGYDIYTLRGNMAYARYLFEKQGVKPWSASSDCWNLTTS